MKNFILNEAVGAYRSARGMAWVSTAVSFTLILIFGVSLYISMMVFNIFKSEKRNIKIDVYLKENLPEGVKLNLFNTIRSLAGVDEVKLVTRDEALKVFKNSYPEYTDLLSVFTDIPFPESYVVEVKPHWKSAGYIEHIINEISVLPGVDEVYAGTEWIIRLSKITFVFIGISFTLLIGLFIAINYVIFQTIRLIMNARKELIEILDLVGATKWTIGIPYLINGTVYGLTGGLLAAVALKILISILSALLIYNLPDFVVIYPVLLLVGTFTGLVASLLSFEEVLP